MSQAIQNGSCIRFTYEGAERTIDVDNVREVGGVWNDKKRRYSKVETLVTGWDHDRKAYRSFHHSKMENIVWITD